MNNEFECRYLFESNKQNCNPIKIINWGLNPMIPNIKMGDIVYFNGENYVRIG